MTCQSRLGSHFSCLFVSDLTDQDNVGVETDNGAQSTGKRYTRLGIDLYLIYTLETVFDRVFNGNNIAAYLVQSVERRIKRCCFTCAGWSAEQQHTIGRHEHSLELFLALRQKSELR